MIENDIFDREILSPRSDYIFRLLFGDERNIEILRGFLSAALDIPQDEYDKIELVDPHLKKETSEDKLGILDVLLHTKSGIRINVEIQLLPVKAMAERITFYASRLLAGQMAEGFPYNAIKKVVCIAILDYNLIADSDSYHNRYRLYDEKHASLFSDVLQIHTMELRKLPEPSEFAGDDLYNWLRFLAADRKEEFEMIATKSPELTKAYAVLKHLSADEQTRLEYEYREKARLDAIGRLAYATDLGLEKGRTEGRAEGKAEMAKHLLENGVPPEIIAKSSGLSIEEISKL